MRILKLTAAATLAMSFMATSGAIASSSSAMQVNDSSSAIIEIAERPQVGKNNSPTRKIEERGISHIEYIRDKDEKVMKVKPNLSKKVQPYLNGKSEEQIPDFPGPF